MTLFVSSVAISSNVYVVDASVWVSSVIPNDANHLPAARWLNETRRVNYTLWAPNIVLPEVAGAVARLTDDVTQAVLAVRSLRRLLASRLVGLDSPLAAMAATVAAELKIRGADAVYVALANQRGFTLVTLDSQQALRAQPLIDVVWLRPES